MARVALLVDLARCTGCRGCQVACKHEFRRPAERADFFAGPGYQNPADLTADTWCLVTFNELERDGRHEWVLGKRQCMHCLEPACAAACPVRALEPAKDKRGLAFGPVIYHEDICIGCRYCMLACPFEVPRFEFNSRDSRITKCTMCAGRQVADPPRLPACVVVCPTEAIVFGGRDEMVTEAQRRIDAEPDKYVDRIYGLDEAGGASVLHIARAPFEKLGYPTNIPQAPPQASTDLAISAIPAALLGLTVLLGASYKLRNRTTDQDADTPDAATTDGSRP